MRPWNWNVFLYPWDPAIEDIFHICWLKKMGTSNHWSKPWEKGKIIKAYIYESIYLSEVWLGGIGMLSQL